MDIIEEAKEDLEKAWDWVKSEAIDLFEDAKPVVDPLITEFETVSSQDVVSVVSSGLYKVEADIKGTKSLADLEQDVLQYGETLGEDIFGALKTLGSNVLQSLIGSVLLKTAAAKV